MDLRPSTCVALLGTITLAACASSTVATHPDVLAGAFATPTVRVEIVSYTSERTRFPGLVSEGLVSLDDEAATARRQLWVTLATTGFLMPVTAGQAKEGGEDLVLEVAIAWACEGGGDVACDGVYSLSARDGSGRVGWKDRIPLGHVAFVSGAGASDFRLRAERLMEGANRLAVGRLKAVLGR